MRKALRLVLTRGRGDQPLELALEVGLIGEARRQCHLDQGPSLSEQGSGLAYPLVEQVSVRGHAVMAAEYSHQVGWGQPGDCAQVLQGEGRRILVLYQLGGAPQMQGRWLAPSGGREPCQQLVAELVTDDLLGEAILLVILLSTIEA